MKLHIPMFLVFATAAFMSCKKDSANTTLRINLTDAPASLEEVNIDLKSVTVKLENDSAQWKELATNPGIYNLLELQNGVDTLIAEATLPQGKVKEIRLVLGNENTVKSGGTVYPLTVPSGAESGLKLKIDKQLTGGIDSLTIDFDAAMSVKLENESYKLRPVLRIKP